VRPIGEQVAVEVVCWHGRIHARVLVERIGRIGGRRIAVGRRFPVSDRVIRKHELLAGHRPDWLGERTAGPLGRCDLPERVVAVNVERRRSKRASRLLDACALAEAVHGISVAGNQRSASGFHVLFGCQHVAQRLVGILDRDGWPDHPVRSAAGDRPPIDR